jgi:phosphoribosylanthranilate isomerase
MTGVKICGINDAVAFDTTIAAGADWLGFNFFPPSPRYVTPAQAADLSARSPGGAARVGLFVNPSGGDIAAALDVVRLDALQLYGAVDFAALRARFGLPVWRAVGVETAQDLPASAGGADRLLVEAKAPAGATRPGGNAVSFDWSVLRGWAAPAPWMLAGGLTVETVAEAVRATGAPAVDVSSGVERSPGVKDPTLIRTFIANARAAGVVYRAATLADVDALGVVHVQAWREAYAGLIPGEVLDGLDPRQRAAMWHGIVDGRGGVHLALLGGAIVGFGSAGPQSDASLAFSSEIGALYVLRAAQRRGVGRQLMAMMARDLLDRGHASASLWVLEANAPARRFYEALGGRVITIREEERDGFRSVGVAYGWDDLRRLV